MNERQQQLWAELSELQISQPGVELSFEARLARENGWDLAQAIEVNQEYRKFLFLMLEAGHPVTPSDQVDQAWHLHLVYTDSYWNHLCGEIAGRPMHHGPTRGGASEGDKFVDWYAKTKISYRKFFGEGMPMEIWPAAETRFGDDIHFQRVNIARNLVIPRPSYWLRRLWTGFLHKPPQPDTATAVIPTPSSSLAAIPLTWGLIHPFDLNGRDFLIFYFVAIVVAVLVAIVLRNLFRNRETLDSFALEKSAAKLSLSEVAFLSQGPKGPVDAAIAQLSQLGYIGVDESKKRLVSLSKPSSKLTILQQAIVSATGSSNGASLIDVRRACGSQVLKLTQTLKDDGLVESIGSFLMPRLSAGLVMFTLIALGVGRIFLGLERGKPVGYLILLIALALIATVFLLQKPRLTMKGNQVLQFLKRSKPNSLSIAPDYRVEQSGLPHVDLAMSVALFGIAAVGTNWLDGNVANLLRLDRTRAGGDGGTYSGCGGGCGGGGCGGGCGGCGGCGS